MPMNYGQMPMQHGMQQGIQGAGMPHQGVGQIPVEQLEMLAQQIQSDPRLMAMLLRMQGDGMQGQIPHPGV